MANYQTIKRLEVLLQLLAELSNPTKQKLLDKLADEYGIDVTARTLERDFKVLETNYGIQISYDRKQHSYAISDEDEEQVVTFLQFAGRIYLGEMLREGMKDFEDLKKAVQLQDNSGFSGLAQIRPILLAIKNKLCIKFTHENYSRQSLTEYIIKPLQLREYRGRWYVIGVPNGEDHIKTFGLGRLRNLKTMKGAKADISHYREQLKKFDDVIGLNYDGAGGKELIELAVSERQYKYLKNLPIHASQEMDDLLSDGRFKISLLVIPNYELVMELLSMGDQVEVLNPASLRDNIHNTLRQTLKQYNHEK